MKIEPDREYEGVITDVYVKTLWDHFVDENVNREIFDSFPQIHDDHVIFVYEVREVKSSTIFAMVKEFHRIPTVYGLQYSNLGKIIDKYSLNTDNTDSWKGCLINIQKNVKGFFKIAF